MRSIARSLALLVLTSALAACEKSEVVDTSTQVTMRISTADSALLQGMTHLRVSASLRESEVRWRAPVANVFVANELRWPVDVPVFPRAASDVGKQFEVVAEALQNGTVLAQARVISNLAPNRRVVLGLPLFLCAGREPGFVCARDCRGPQCQVCSESGECVDVRQVDATSLTDLPQSLPAIDGSIEPVIPVEGTPPTGPTPGAPPSTGGSAAGAGGAAAGTDVTSPLPGAGGTTAGPSVAIADACRGSEGQALCGSAGELLVCNKDGTLASQQRCMSARHCQAGLVARSCASCIPGEFDCVGASLRVCDAQGKAFGEVENCGTAALCNKLLGDCTTAVCEPNKAACLSADTLATCNADGSMVQSQRSCGTGLCDRTAGECDVCQVGQKRCEQDQVATCNAQGQGYDLAACPSDRRKCVGAGQCAACAVASDCGEPGICRERVCATPGGTCTPRVVADHTACTNLGQAGVCSAGSCVGCINDSDCRSRGTLTACNTTSRQCVAPARCGDGVAQSEAGEECDDGNTINEDACLNSCKRATCGDGVIRNAGVSTMLEQCDPRAPGWSTRTCGTDCKRSIYVSNRSGCPAGTTAPLWGVCTVSCNVDSDCPVVPNMATPFCFPSVKICAIYCTSQSQCPSGLTCNLQSSGAMAECNGII